jgi:hypothetical protein
LANNPECGEIIRLAGPLRADKTKIARATRRLSAKPRKKISRNYLLFSKNGAIIQPFVS